MRNTRRQKNQEKIIKKESNYYFFGWTSSGCWEGSYVYFQSHFLPTTKSKWSFCRLVKCKCCRRKKLAQVNQTEEVVVQTGTKRRKIQLPKNTNWIKKIFLKDHLHSSKVKLPLNEAFKKN